MRTARILLVLAVAAAALAAWLLSAPPAVVDWSAVRAVAFHSDDWGLCGFVPDAGALDGLDRALLRAGAVLPVYWGSTLEDSAAVADLAAVLAAHRGADGLPPVWQPNYIVSSLALAAGDGAPAPVWRRHDLPDLPPPYARPGLWRAVEQAQAAGLWRPELHGSFHYDPDLRRAAVTAGPVAAAAARGVLPFPGSNRAWELGPWRSRETLAAELDGALAVFARLFGRRPASIMAPDYVWDGRCERLWQQRGLAGIQGKREQRNPRWDRLGPAGRLLKAAERTWSRRVQGQRVYLERNCRFEPAQSGDGAATVEACLREVRAAWARGEPAIVESHRVNFVHLDPALAAGGREALAELLRRLHAPGEPTPLYLCDAELIQLQRGGTSVLVRGGRLVARNLTQALRLVALPPAAGGPGEGGGRFLPLPAGSTLVLPWPQGSAGALPGRAEPTR